MRAEWEAPGVVNCVTIGLASALGPVLALVVCAAFVRGEAFWLIPTIVLGVPASAVVGTIAAAVIHRAKPTRLSTLRTWLVTAAAAALPCIALIFDELETVTPWVAAPLVSGALLGAVPPALLAGGLAARARRGEG